MHLLADLRDEGRTIIVVTHDESTAAYAERELLIRDGMIASDRKQEGRKSVDDAVSGV
jgi:putative ABC transport system ATP-binding protein